MHVSLIASLHVHLQASSSSEPGQAPRVCLAITIGPQSVTSHPDFTAWQSSCGSSWRHVLATAGQQQLVTLPRAALFQAKLNCLHPHLYPLWQLDSAVQPPAVPQYRSLLLAGEGAACMADVSQDVKLPEQGSSLHALSLARVHLVPPAQQGLYSIDMKTVEAPEKVCVVGG